MEDKNNSVLNDSNYMERPLYPNEIRLSIFYISAVCVGAPCLIWAFYFVHLQRKARRRISAFIIFLLIIDMLQLVLYSCIVSELLFFKIFQDVTLPWFVYLCLKTCGHHLQQQVAFEGVLTLKYPQFSAHSCCYIIITIILILCVAFCTFLFIVSPFFLIPFFVSVLAHLCLLVVIGIITCKATVNNHRPGTLIFLVTLINSTVLYLPCVNFILPRSVYENVDVMFNCLSNLTVISDPLLCVLVCRVNLRTQKQTHIELNCEETSV